MRKIILATFGIVVLCVLADFAFAHCDTLEGPVVKDARLALEKGNVTPVLKWVKRSDEKEVKAAFKTAMDERKKGGKEIEAADMIFFETLVKIHRVGEGFSFTGLKPASDVEPAVASADRALESGNPDDLIKMMDKDIAAGIRERFNETVERQKSKDESVKAGRQYVEAYIEFTHYVERLHTDAIGKVPEEHHGH